MWCNQLCSCITLATGQWLLHFVLEWLSVEMGNVGVLLKCFCWGEMDLHNFGTLGLT